jgi:DNA-binding LacI/PurR family transcriptional regulator
MTIKEIAKKLGVSPSTVSMVINNRPGISAETRNRVLRMIEKTGYSTHGLKSTTIRDGGNIQLIVFKKHSKIVADTPFFSLLIEGLESGAQDYGYQLAITYLTGGSFSADKINGSLKRNNISGVVVLATEMDESDIGEVLKIDVPAVILDSYFLGMELDSIIINNTEGSYLATKYLIQNGHKKIGYLSSSININNFDEREIGYKIALNNYNIDYSEGYCIKLEPTMEGAYSDMTNCLKRNIKLPTAFFADNDIIAFGAIKALKENNYKIPDDISIVGFDNMPFCTMINPPLTTINIDKKVMGKITIERLIQKIQRESSNFLKTELGVTLVVRESVKNLI